MSFYDHPRRGVGIPDTRFSPANEVTADAIGDESGPRAGGLAEPDSASARLAVEATGDQDTDLVLQVEQGGHPTLGAGARVSYRTSSEAATARRGWNAPNLITGWTAADYSTTANTMVCALAMGNGQILVAYRAGSTTAYFQTYTPDTDTWSGTIAFPSTVSSTGAILMTQLPEGSIIVAFRSGSNGEWEAYRYSIADAVSGGSWEFHGQNMLDSVPGTLATSSKMIVMPTGEIAIFYGYSNALWQYASMTSGATFTRVAAGTPTAATRSDAVLTASGKIIVVAAVGTVPTSYTLGSPWTPYSSVTGVTIAAGFTTQVEDQWLAADPNGRVYWFGRATADDAIRYAYTDDDGATWSASTTSACVMQNGDANTYATGGQAVHTGGAVWLCHQFSDSVATQDASVCLMKLGGWSSIQMRTTGTDYDDPPSAGISLGGIEGSVLLPIGLPVNTTGFTTAGTAGNFTLSGGRNMITCAASTAYFYPVTPAAGDAAFVQFRIAVTAGTSETTHQTGAKIRLTSGANDYEIGVYITTTKIAVYDVIGIAALTTSVTPPTAPSSDTDVFIYFRPNAVLFVAYKKPGDSTWTEVFDGAGTTAVATTGSRYIQIGASAVATTSTQGYRYVWMLSFPYTLGDKPWFSASSSSAGNTPVGRLLTSRPAAIDKRSAYGRRQTYLRAKDGPGRVTDTFQARVRADYPREAVMWQHAPSPRTAYKTTEATTGMAMAWQPAVGVNTSLGSPCIFMAVLNTNVPIHQLYGDPDDGGGYDLIGTLTLTTGFSGLTYARTGNVIRINGGTKGSRYVWEGEFVGASINLAGVARRIDRHTSGVWNTTGRYVEIVLATTGDGAYTGAEAASGTCSIIAHSGVVVIPDVNAATYKKFKWVAAGAQVVTDSAYRTGQVLIGPVEVFGQQWDWGWSHDYSVPVADTETRPGVVRRSALGPAGCEWSIGWTEGVDQLQARLASTTVVPNHLAAGAVEATSHPEATSGDVPFKLAGLLEKTRGGEVPVVVLPKLPTTAASITDPTLFLYGRMAPTVRIENIQGNEGEDEMYRVSSIPVTRIT
jgi:hypothetical protein